MAQIAPFDITTEIMPGPEMPPFIVGVDTAEPVTLETLAFAPSARTARIIARPLLDKMGDLTERFEDEVRITPAGARAIYIKNRLKHVAHASAEDIRESDNRVSTLGWMALTGISQIADRGMVSLILVPEVATNVLESTRDGRWTGLAGGAAYFLWTTSVGGVLSHGMRRYPKTVEASAKSFPGIVDLFTDGLPGIKSAEEVRNGEQPKPPVLKRFLGGLSTHIKRGLAGLQIGSTAFVATSHVNGYSNKDVMKENLRVGMDTGVATGLICWMGGTAILEYLSRGDFVQAQDLLNTLEDSRTWYSVAGGVIGLQFLGSRLGKWRKNRKAAAIQ